MTEFEEYKLYQLECQSCGAESMTYPLWKKRVAQKAAFKAAMKKQDIQAPDNGEPDVPKPKRKPRKKKEA